MWSFSTSVSKQSGTKLVHTSGVTTINFVNGVCNQTQLSDLKKRCEPKLSVMGNTTAGNMSGNSCFMVLSSTAYNSVWISTVSLNLHLFKCTFIFGDRKILGTKFLFYLASSCTSLHVESRFASGPHSADRAQILLKSASMLKSLVQMHQHVLYNRPRMLIALLKAC
jgi:hypothetical protein